MGKTFGKGVVGPSVNHLIQAHVDKQMPNQTLCLGWSLGGLVITESKVHFGALSLFT